jgi:hypothetical protein
MATRTVTRVEEFAQMNNSGTEDLSWWKEN